jgi:hypothetical protein
MINKREAWMFWIAVFETKPWLGMYSTVVCASVDFTATYAPQETKYNASTENTVNKYYDRIVLMQVI